MLYKTIKLNITDHVTYEGLLHRSAQPASARLLLNRSPKARAKTEKRHPPGDGTLQGQQGIGALLAEAVVAYAEHFYRILGLKPASPH